MHSNSPADKTMRKIIAGAVVVGGTVATVKHCNNQNPPPPPAAMVDNTPSSMAILIGEQKARMEAQIKGMAPEQINDYLCQEAAVAVSMRARGILDGEPSDLYYDFVPRSNAIAAVLERQEKSVRESVAAKLRLRQKIFEGNPSTSPVYQQKLREVFSASYASSAEAEAAIARHSQSTPDFAETIHNEIMNAYVILCDKIAQNKGRGG